MPGKKASAKKSQKKEEEEKRIASKQKREESSDSSSDDSSSSSSSSSSPVKRAKKSPKRSPKSAAKKSPKKSPKSAAKKSPKKSPKAAPKRAKKRQESSSSESSSDSESGSDSKSTNEENDPLHVNQFDIAQETKDALKKKGITKLFPIQGATYKLIAEGKDIIGKARTGCGKTLAFALPIIQTLLNKRAENKRDSTRRGRAPAVIVLAPTRELAQQVGKEFESVAPSFVVLNVYGGAPMGKQCQALQSGVDILVGTPGRILDHLDRGTLDLSRIEHVVLDEADKMLEMGFQEDVDKILEKATKKHQKCLFSATVPEWVSGVAEKHMVDHQLIDMAGDDQGVMASLDVRHIAIASHWTAKSNTISDVIAMYAGTTGRALCFCSTKAECNDLCSDESIKYEAKALHGDIPQNLRESTLESFRKGKFRLLVATDVAARGLDMQVDLVLNACPPETRSGYPEVETYVHRSGRTGRAGRKGVCVTLYSAKQKRTLQQIERKTGNNFEWLDAPQPSQVMHIAAATAMDDAARIPEKVLANFSKAADQLIEKIGDEKKAVAAALALATSNTEAPPERSLLTGASGYTTYMFHAKNNEIWALGYVWGALNKVLPEEFTEKDKMAIMSMQVTADRWGAVFDVRADAEEHLKKALKFDWLSCPDKLPELLEQNYDRKGGKGGKGGGKGGKKGGKGGKKGGRR
eukprot:TRINITY_DN871_c0_g3_i2.p1 TRINITY_DN871_c0_g3~~TRINITY_DN871_c0_g3_i2.p1  ORF type:complete len:693 (+),score=182.64 TRINITY_DN871_c0_g3_i2:62-2140(+)